MTPVERLVSIRIPEEDAQTSRSTVINWKNQVRTIVDGYRECRGISHGVQKDAVQNAWDARTERRSRKRWSMTFELIRGRFGTVYFTMTDAGSTGLTGRVLVPSELQEDLPAVERWGRFENVAFTKRPEEEALGARGRGKFIFVGASKDLMILYDTLRHDGSYRFGYRTIELTDSPVNSFDDDIGRQRLDQYTKGELKPLGQTGTRVIIVNPVDELQDAINSGEFLRYIGETWWEIILNQDTKIHVITEAHKKTAKAPAEFKLPDKDSSSSVIWKKDNLSIRAGGEEYKIKHLHFIRNLRGEVPEDIRGIAIQRGGMKIHSLPMHYVPQEIANSVYGYVSFDRKLDRAMMQEEGIEHYNFDYRKAVPRAVKQKIEDELGSFAREKLGLGVNPETIRHERQSNAERRAVYAVNRILKNLGISVRRRSIGGPLPPPGPPPPTPPPRKKIRLEMPDFVFPREIRRVNYGEWLRQIRLRAVNDSDKKITVNVKMYILQGQQQLGEHLKNRDIELEPGAHVDFEPQDLAVTQDHFPTPGQYSIRAHMLAIQVPGLKKGKEIHKTGKTFYVEEDPPESGLFEKCEGMDYPEEVHAIMGEAVPGEGEGYVFQYNLNHPACKAHDATEDELTGYLVGIMANEIPRVILRAETQTIFNEEEISDPELFARKISMLLGEILYDYYIA